jgi:hypothetical protein
MGWGAHLLHHTASGTWSNSMKESHMPFGLAYRHLWIRFETPMLQSCATMFLP